MIKQNKIAVQTRSNNTSNSAGTNNSQVSTNLKSSVAEMVVFVTLVDGVFSTSAPSTSCPCKLNETVNVQLLSTLFRMTTVFPKISSFSAPFFQNNLIISGQALTAVLSFSLIWYRNARLKRSMVPASSNSICHHTAGRNQHQSCLLMVFYMFLYTGIEKLD